MSSALTTLLSRLAEDGGRYLLSIGLSKDEINDGQTPTYGGKSTSRWLTEEEYRLIFSALTWLENESGRSTKQPDKVGIAGKP